MGKGNNQTTPKKNDDHIAALNAKLASLEAKVACLEDKNKSLENKVVLLESQQAVCSKVTKELSKELDRLGQYTRRANIVIKNVFLPEKETNEDVAHVVNNIIKDDLKLPNEINNIDKLHCIGKVKNFNGRKNQDIIVRFKSHASRYKVFNSRKTTKKVNIRPNLTPSRGKLLFEANELISSVDEVDFAYADLHGDLKFRLVREYEGKFVFPFFSLEELKSSLSEMGFLA